MFSTPNFRSKPISSENALSLTARKPGTSTTALRKPLIDISVNKTPSKLPLKDVKEKASIKTKPSFTIAQNPQDEDNFFDFICAKKVVKDTYEDIFTKSTCDQMSALSRTEVLHTPPQEIDFRFFETINSPPRFNSKLDDEPLSFLLDSEEDLSLLETSLDDSFSY